MNYNQVIKLLIFNGDPNGQIMTEIENWNGRVYKISRAALAAFSERPDAAHTGVYFLFGRDQAMNDTVYVGEAEKMSDRLRQHLNDSSYWNDCIAVISTDNHLNKAHVKYLEHAFYTLAKNAGRYTITNVKTPTQSSLSEYDTAMLAEFIIRTTMLVGTLGYKVFDSIVKPALPGQASEFFYIRAAHGTDAKGLSTADGFTVLTGSIVADGVTPSSSEPLKKMRARLLESGIINAQFRFTRDYMFSSPSTAASIVMGRSANGRTEWHTADGRTLKAIEEAQLTQ